jgi:outer membrane lipoprotein
MRIGRISTAVLAIVVCAVLWGCYSSSILPPELQSQVDHGVGFAQLKESPDQYRGRLVLFGGEVLSAKRLKDGTRIELLQLPLDDRQIPIPDKTASEGRFLSIQKDFLDPAKIPPGTRMTIAGEVTGSTTLPLDEAEYTYPVLEVKNLTVWPDMDRAWRGSAYPRPYWGYPYGGWRRWGPMGPSPYNPYWW